MIDKAIKLLKTAVCVNLNKEHMCGIKDYTDALNDNFKLIWNVNNNMIDSITLKELFENYYDVNNGEFYSVNSNASYNYISFKTMVPVEISVLFKTPNNICNIFKKYGRNVLMYYNNNNENDINKMLIPSIYQSLDFLKIDFDDLEDPNALRFLNLEKLIKQQEYVENNIVYTSFGSFELYLLSSISFNNITIY